MPLGKLVSIVDDDTDITTLFYDALHNNIDHASVVTFNSPILALEHFSKYVKRYAVVISDMRMRGLSGLELLQRVKELNAGVRTILISAYEFLNNPLVEKSVRRGIINSYIEKPIKIDSLRQIVRNEFRNFYYNRKRKLVCQWKIGALIVVTGMKTTWY